LSSSRDRATPVSSFLSRLPKHMVAALVGNSDRMAKFESKSKSQRKPTMFADVVERSVRRVAPGRRASAAAGQLRSYAAKLKRRPATVGGLNASSKGCHGPNGADATSCTQIEAMPLPRYSIRQL
jgi:hypothetical protein